jgi:manganese transport protein
MVGTVAGQITVQGFVEFRIPIWLRRLVTMILAFAAISMGVSATDALVVPQIELSIAPLIFTNRADIKGAFVNSRGATARATVAAAAALSLNMTLLAQSLYIAIPGAPGG